jgi:hypothetical protein
MRAVAEIFLGLSLEHNTKNAITKTPTTLVKQKALKHEFSELGL